MNDKLTKKPSVLLWSDLMKKTMKHLLWIGVLLILLNGCSDYSEMTSSKVSDSFSKKTKLQGSGKGGIIEIVNAGDIPFYVTWSGVGCGEVKEGLSLVCETGEIDPLGSKTYKYNWGVTATWVNVGDFLDDLHPCSPLASKTLREKSCYFDHRKVNTKADKVTLCTIYGAGYGKENYSMDCRLYSKKSRQTKGDL